MGEYKLALYVGTETSEEEMEAIRTAFAEHFDVSIEKAIDRFSEASVPLLISITLGVVSNVVYDLLKAAIKKLLNRSSPGIKRSINVELTQKEHVVVIASGGYFADQSRSEEIRYESVDELFENLKTD